jgi:hypothetical protein
MDHHEFKVRKRNLLNIMSSNHLTDFLVPQYNDSWTTPHEEHMKYVLQVVQLQPTLYQGYI